MTLATLARTIAMTIATTLKQASNCKHSHVAARASSASPALELFKFNSLSKPEVLYCLPVARVFYRQIGDQIRE